MTAPTKKTYSQYPVIGLFANELELRDALAANLNLIEPGLELLAKEYYLSSPHGADGRIDIVARDSFAHIVCIEIKRSDTSARSGIHELSKYVALLVEQERIPREMIRCVVVSTDWHELSLPLSYFAASGEVDVRGFVALNIDGSLALEGQPLLPLAFLPQLSPEIDLLQFATEHDRCTYVAHVLDTAMALPEIRVALLQLDLERPGIGDEVPFRIVACIWRIAERHLAAVEAAIGQPVGSMPPYGFPGWEAECDTLEWICGRNAPGVLPTFAEERRGTAEKISSLLARYDVSSINRVGAWPRSPLINDDDHILRQIRALSISAGAHRRNRHTFEAKVTPLAKPSWRAQTQAFMDFIAFESAWEEPVRSFFERWQDRGVAIELYALDKRHFYHLLHQARRHSATATSTFRIDVIRNGETIDALHGYYSWDGKTCPRDPEAGMRKIYGSLEWAVLAIWNAIDQHRYDVALRVHGFKPVIDKYGEAGERRSKHAVRRTPRDFVTANPRYAAKVSAVLERFGNMPTDPTGLVPQD
ncbi:endonuclease NucS domain-containing protein [Qipengyuania sp. 483]